ncbi:stretch-activated Ca2+-permeable channel component-domain-containing protein [Gymnopilus junonius]|uniref:Stretch-activated Ca2+-permeable channel component-domain-containing protein n=1 Tax=Gymnopilus junonius TaxID=109634 RepID=A0A9P5NHK1_GYMJU|nr:stretch-activated Ca2+-permeable channel component-domain-containing protein [Gymnopilus junonius]
MLPLPLLWLLSSSLALIEARTALSIDDITSLNTGSLPNPPSFSIPSQGEDGSPLSVTIALCSDASPSPRFFLSNVSNADSQPDPSSSSLGSSSREVVLTNGFGNWTAFFPNGGVLAVDVNGASNVQFDIGVSDGDPIHEALEALPLLGDTTANQAILFSAPFSPLPSIPVPTSALSNTNITLLITPTSRGTAATNPLNSACFLSAKPSTGKIANQTVWARDTQGFRVQWLVEGLIPSTNYTAYVLNGTKVSGPIYFATKSASFSCPLVHSLPYCPSVAYSGTYDALTLPSNISTPLLSYLTNFTTVVNTFACGRDWYSPLVGCNDCQREYRAWLCATSFTRCSEPSPGNPSGFTSIPPEPSATGIFASLASLLPGSSNANSKQQPLSALLPQPTSAPQRNAFLPAFPSTYTQLLPCIEQCQAVDRACPPFIGFKCPVQKFNAGASYGVGYVDGPGGEKGKGLAGVSQDRWGNVWCNYVEAL